MRTVPGILAVAACLLFVSANANTPDGSTPADELICTDAGLTGAAWGLCNAFCEAMDCDADGGGPNASDNACNRVLAKFLERTGDGFLPPCLDPDTDGDGVADSEDNCPAVSNPDQGDRDSDGVGDGCDNCPTIANVDQAEAGSGKGAACDCPCFDHVNVDQVQPSNGSTVRCDQNTTTVHLRELTEDGVTVLQELLATTAPQNGCTYRVVNPDNSEDLETLQGIADAQVQACKDLIFARVRSGSEEGNCP